MSNGDSGEKNSKKYYVGLDIGTDSVGWAVTDQDYHLVRKQGKHLWGSRLFDEAQTAEGRRMARGTRRRLERRKWRILLLQDLFKPEMDKVDPDFFDRLNNSALHAEDKPEKCRKPFLLFNDNGMTDKKFYQDYPTIYHLRMEMMTHPEKKYDIREIYLVMAHMVKYRGNFLMEGNLTDKPVSDPQILVDDFNGLDDLLSQEENSLLSFQVTTKQAEELIKVFQEKTRISELAEEISKALNVDRKDPRENYIKLISGSSMALSALYPDIEDEDIKKTKLDFTNEDFRENLPSLAANIGDNRFQILAQIGILYDYRILINFLKGKDSLSEAMIGVYTDHQCQLKILKDLVKRYNRPAYAGFFRRMDTVKGQEIKNYANYVGYLSVKGKAVSGGHRTSQEDLYKAIKGILPFDQIGKGYAWQQPEDEGKLKDILASMEANKYLPRQNSKENGVFPYQLNLREMDKIIANQSKYYPFLAEKAKDYTNPDKTTYKIDSILEFRIPYYVGPLSNRPVPEGKESNRWAVRKGEEKITPWNFHDVIDEEASARGFMDRLKNPCTYLIGEKTLPLGSLIYQDYILYNEMNSWLINGKPITEEDKDYLVENVYKKAKKVTINPLKAALKAKYKSSVRISTKGSGKELDAEDVHASLSSYIVMSDSRAFGPGFEKDGKKLELAEEVIENLTSFEDKTMKERSLKKLGLSDSQIGFLSPVSFSGWGKLSKKLLDGLTTEVVNTSTGETLDATILYLLKHTSYNFMEIYNGSSDGKDLGYTFRKQVEELNHKSDPSEEDIIEAEYASPAMKRALMQTLKVVKEIKEILKVDHIDSYFVEATRGATDQGRTTSRKRTLQKTYQAAKSLVTKELSDALENSTDSELRSKRLYLYFMQLGRDVYSGKPIDLNQINKDYDIDHIIPQAKVKDDSFLNTVLVARGLNNTKSDTYPIPEGTISEEGKQWIETLNRIDKGALMPKEKMERLLRPASDHLTVEEETGFVQRQLVMTNQSVKAVCDILRQIDPKAKTVFSKAGQVSDFRGFFHLPKCREINDFHHANDAYLNIVVGNAYNKVFSAGFNSEIYKKNQSYFESLKLGADHFFTRNEHMLYTDSLVWKSKHYYKNDMGHWVEDPKSEGTIDLVRKTLSWNDPLVSQRTYENKGKQGFFNKISIRSAEDGKASFPLKQKAPFNSTGWETKYGGYSDLVTPYYMLVRSDGKKGKKNYSLEGVPSIFLTGKEKEKDIQEYLTKNLELKNPEVVVDKVPIRTELDGEDGTKLGITGRSGTSIITVNLSPLKLNTETAAYMKLIARALGTNLPSNQKVDLDVLAKLEKNNIAVGDSLLTQEKNLEVFDYLCKLFKQKCYSNLPGVGKSLREMETHRDVFQGLLTVQQIQILQRLCLLAANKPLLQDMSLLGLAPNTGAKLISKNLQPGTKLYIPSPTGFYKKLLYTIPSDKE